ncbi:hypothetical protein [Nocardioides sp. GY 10127]|uniref:hypothetical protein n=1 Tax=Nocardioides sp. GY 10127 TaxID=2569762 RepID=UPI0010A8965B|nr:hypothetical protein [Nocardioides sp. GY 10127]TIC84006.1 hypothetical protein E8D37_04120 [Nocardioides sp. GY 10127]
MFDPDLGAGGPETLRELHTVVPAALYYDLGRDPADVSERTTTQSHLLDWAFGAQDDPVPAAENPVGDAGEDAGGRLPRSAVDLPETPDDERDRTLRALGMLRDQLPEQPPTDEADDAAGPGGPEDPDGA